MMYSSALFQIVNVDQKIRHQRVFNFRRQCNPGKHHCNVVTHLAGCIEDPMIEHHEGAMGGAAPLVRQGIYSIVTDLGQECNTTANKLGASIGRSVPVRRYGLYRY